MSRQLSLFLSLLLVMTVTIKAMAAYAAATAIHHDPDRIMIRALEEAGFTVDEVMDGTDPAVTPARREECRLLFARVAPLGWHRDLFSRFLQPDETLRFLFRGEITEAQPVWTTSASYFRMRLLRYAGIPAEEEPVWALVVTENCRHPVVEWPEVR